MKNTKLKPWFQEALGHFHGENFIRNLMMMLGANFSKK